VQDGGGGHNLVGAGQNAFHDVGGRADSGRGGKAGLLRSAGEDGGPQQRQAQLGRVLLAEIQSIAEVFGVIEVVTHDAGGKNAFPLLPGVVGRAEFAGDHQEHRLWLERQWGDDPRYALWCGMNASTAMEDIDDMTLRKDQAWTRAWGLSRMFKVNIGSYRCTGPEGLSERDVTVNHEENVPTILRLAQGAQIIVIACGSFA
jgi:Protein of unknown function (DUF1643)